jgi:hypothetical protein
VFKIHTKDGETIRVDLQDEDQARELLQRLKSNQFQEQITGIAILQKCTGRFKCPTCKRSKKLVCAHCGRREPLALCDKNVQYTLSRPEGFDQFYYHVEDMERDDLEGLKGAEKITCFVDDVRITMVVHREQPSTRIALLKTGRQRYNPLAE